MKNGKRGVFLMREIGGNWWKQAVTKSCGLLLYMFHKNHNYNAYMVGTNLDKEISEYAAKWTPGVQICSMSENTLAARINWMQEHAEEIDVMYVYGTWPAYIPIVDAYKQIRPDGKIFSDSDMNIAWADRLVHTQPDFKRFLSNIDVLGAGCRATQKYLNAKWHVPVNLIRNPFYNFAKVSFDNLFENKQNIILTVGRIGTNQKQNNIMMEAFAKVADELPDWKMRLVGGVQENFKPYIEKFFEQYPNLKERVIFVGEISDRAKLMEEYKRAKIFALSSNMEGGTPNVTAEALYGGDFIITSNFDSWGDMTDNGKCGKVFPIGNIDEMSKIFLEVCRDEKLLLEGGKHARIYAREQFDANHVVARLNYLLYGGK